MFAATREVEPGSSGKTLVLVAFRGHDLLFGSGGAGQGGGRDPRALNINAFKDKSWLVMLAGWMWLSQRRLRVTTTHLLLFPSLTTLAWVRGRQERLRQRPARLWCHPTGTVTSSKTCSKLPRKNLLRGETGLTGPDKRLSCPHLSGVSPPINKLHFFCNWRHKYKNVRLSWTSHRLERSSCRRFQFRRHFYSVLFKVEEKTADSVICVSIVRLLIQKCCCLPFCIVRLSETWK